MKKIIRNLLIGFVPFFPVEKVQAEPSMDSDAKVLFDTIDKDDLKTTVSKTSVQEVEELLKLADEMGKDNINMVTNITSHAKKEVSSQSSETEVIDILLKENVEKSTNGISYIKSPFKKTNPLKSEEINTSKDTKSTNVEIIASQNKTDHVPPHSNLDLKALASTNDVAKKTIVATNSTDHGSTGGNSKEVSKGELKVSGSNSVDKLNAVSPVVENSNQNYENSVVLSSVGIMERPQQLTRIMNNPTETSIKNPASVMKSWFSGLFSGLFLSAFAGAVWGILNVKKQARKNDLLQAAPSGVKSDKTSEIVSEIPKKMEEAVSNPKKQKRSRKIKQDSAPKYIFDEQSHQKGIRMLANIKLRRSIITCKMKTLRQELAQYQPSEKKIMEINQKIEALQDKRNQLTREHRLARSLVKGVEGERIREERRLLAKEMRLAKKSNNVTRLAEITDKRAELSAKDKALMKMALAEAKERTTTADWWHGKRLYQEALEKENQFNTRIQQLKKETGFKKADILELKGDIKTGLKATRHQKSMALRQMKGRQFIEQKRLLSSQIIAAHRIQDLETETKLKADLVAVKSKEKEYVKWAKSFDYSEGRRLIVPNWVRTHALRRDQAKAWKGYRMLRDLTQGLVPSVKSNQISSERYQTKALALIGKDYQKSFDYEMERGKVLKPATLASIYLSHKQQNIA